MDNSDDDQKLMNIFIDQTIKNDSESSNTTTKKLNSSDIKLKDINFSNKQDYILTMKVNISDNNVNEVIIPESVSIDKLISVPKKKYLEELSKYKKDELEEFKNELKEESDKKLDYILKTMMHSYDLNKKSSIIPNELNNKKDDPFTMEYHMIKNIDNNIPSNTINHDVPFVIDNDMIQNSTYKNPINKKSRYKKQLPNSTASSTNSDSHQLSNNKTISSDIFSEYFDCVYIINLPDERNKITSLIKTFNENNVKYKIIDGVDIKNNLMYIKQYKRWLFQKTLEYRELTKFLFDERIYIRKNPDLKVDNKTACWNHWMHTGRFENRPLYEHTNISLESQLGNLIAHMNALKHAISKKHENILILEDDVYIHKKFNELHTEVITKLPEYSILFYGGIQKTWTDIEIKNGFYKTINTYGGFAFALNKKYFKYVLDSMEELTLPVDKLLINIQNTLNNSFVIYPNIFITDLENGKIHRKRNFNKYSKHFKWKVDDYIMPLKIENESI